MPLYPLPPPSFLTPIQLPSPSALLLPPCSLAPLRLPLLRVYQLSKPASAEVKGAFASQPFPPPLSQAISMLNASHLHHRAFSRPSFS